MEIPHLVSPELNKGLLLNVSLYVGYVHLSVYSAVEVETTTQSISCKHINQTVTDALTLQPTMVKRVSALIFVGLTASEFLKHNYLIICLKHGEGLIPKRNNILGP